MALTHGSGCVDPRGGSIVADRSHGRPVANDPVAFAECDQHILPTLMGEMDHGGRPALAVNAGVKSGHAAV